MMNIPARTHRRNRSAGSQEIQFRYYTDGTAIWRKGVLDGEWITERRTIDNNFEIPDIMPQYLFYYSENGTVLWRDGVRNENFVLDKALTPAGFDGNETTTDDPLTGDWINKIETH